MSFYDTVERLSHVDLRGFLDSVTPADVARTLERPGCSEEDFLTLLSPAAGEALEAMAQRAHSISVSQFGRVVQLFTPIYVSNFCSNGCVYCGFNHRNRITRRQLTLDEVHLEAEVIAASGLKQVLVLTGDAPRIATIDYLIECCRILNEYFSSVAVEIYALTQAEYGRLVKEGHVDGLTLFQETYNPALYETLHPLGPKRDYRFRLDAPERGAAAGMRVVNVGALLGLDDWRTDAFFTGLHAAYLQERYPGVEVSVSLPRIRPHVGLFTPAYPVGDAEFVQILLAQRIYMPRLGICISTRERPSFREHLIPLGVTRMSAGVSTAVGGRSRKDDSTGQFDISDERTVAEMAAAISQMGYQPVYQEWQPVE